jgi:ribosome-binding ATPase
VLQRILDALEHEQRVSELEFSEEEKSLIADQNFLTEKPLIVAVNLDEKQLSKVTTLDVKK